MSSKRQITMAKIAREQALRERRTRKQDKKDAKRAARDTPVADGTPSDEDDASGEDIAVGDDLSGRGQVRAERFGSGPQADGGAH